MKLNGWQRLWIVSSALWLVCVSILTYNIYYSSHKNDAEIYHAWVNETLEYLIAQVPELKDYTVSTLRNDYADIADKELKEALHKKFIPKHPAYEYGLTEIDSKYENRITSKSENTRFILFPYILLAIGFPIILYVFGWTIAWIKNGFYNA